MPDERTTVHSYPDRARYDREFAWEVLDAGRFGHLATVVDGGPHIVPMMYMRVGDAVHVHTRRNTPLSLALAGGADVAFAVTLVDGIVLASEVRYHSLNYRSLVVHARPEPLLDEASKRASFIALAEHVWPGRAGVGEPTSAQLAAATVFALPLERFSGKTRTGGPLAGDDIPDVWTGHVDLGVSATAFHGTAVAHGVPAPSWPFAEFAL